MNLPPVIKINGLKLVKSESPYDITYSTVLEAKSVTISTAINKAVSQARTAEEFLEKKYNIVYSGFNFLTKTQLNGEWLVVIEAEFTKKDYYPEMQPEIDAEVVEEEVPAEPIQAEATSARASSASKKSYWKFTHFNLIDKLAVLQIVDDLEMAISRKPAVTDIIAMSRKYGLDNTYRTIHQLIEEGHLEQENGRVGRRVV